MYQTFYNMRLGPFPTQPIPEVFFKSRTHGEALSFIQQGIREHESFLLVTGEYGLGKTLLCLRLMKAFRQNRGQYYFVYIPNASYTYEMMLLEMNRVLGFEATSETRLAVLQSNLFEFYKKKGRDNKRFFIVIDDFQEIDSATLQHLKLLANFNTEEGFFPFSLILFAHPMILDRLKPPLFTSLQQKIKRHFRLTPFNYEETREYIYFRLLYSGARGKPFFTEEAVRYIYQVSKGNPRFINNICDASLMVGSKMKRERIEKKIVTEAVRVLAQNQKNEKFLSSLRRSTAKPIPPATRTSEDHRPSRPHEFTERPAAPVPPRRPDFLHDGEGRTTQEFPGRYNEPPGAEIDFTNISGGFAPAERRQGSLRARPPNGQWGIENFWGKKVVRWFVWGVILVLIILLFYRYRTLLLGKVSEQPMRYKIDRNYTEGRIISKSGLQIISPAGRFMSSSLSTFQGCARGYVKYQRQKNPMHGTDSKKREAGKVKALGVKQNISSQGRIGLDTRLLFSRVAKKDYTLPFSKVKFPDLNSGIKGEKSTFYSLILSSHLNRDNAMEEISSLKRGKLFPVFLKKLQAHGKVWWVIFQGTYKNRRMAEEVKALYHFSNAMVRKVRARELKGAVAFVEYDGKNRFCQKEPNPSDSWRKGRDTRIRKLGTDRHIMNLILSPAVIGGLNQRSKEAIYSLLCTCYNERKQVH